MKRLLSYFQSELGLTRSESVVVSSIISILLVGYIGRLVVPQKETHDVVATQRVIALLDSMQATFVADSSEKTFNSVQTSPENAFDIIPKPPNEKSNKKTNRTLHGRVNINTANRATLMQLPGIGPAMADRVISERAVRPFSTVDELARVKGIGPKKLEKIRPFVTVP